MFVLGLVFAKSRKWGLIARFSLQGQQKIVTNLATICSRSVPFRPRFRRKIDDYKNVNENYSKLRK
jgi:hypothetical protein